MSLNNIELEMSKCLALFKCNQNLKKMANLGN